MEKTASEILYSKQQYEADNGIVSFMPEDCIEAMNDFSAQQNTQLKADLDKAVKIIKELDDICRGENNWHFKTDIGIEAKLFLFEQDR